jgi:hypothetical protein
VLKNDRDFSKYITNADWKYYSMENTRFKTTKFQIGDQIKVRSKDEISKTLDTFKRLDGCLMMDQMWGFCGRKSRVQKVVNNFFDEHKYKMYKIRAPLYLLEGLICSGVVEAFERRCDRSCYMLWHEDWLEKS